YAALRVGWTRHTSRLEDSVITPAPDLDIIGASVEGGLAWRWNTFTTRVGIVGGLEYLHVTSALQSLNPCVGAVASVSWDFFADFGVVASFAPLWTFGTIGEDGGTHVGASFT